MKKIWITLLLASCALAQKPDKPLKNGLYAIFKTEMGDMTAVLFEKDTPGSVALFVGLGQGTQKYMDTTGKIVTGRYYDNTTFFRIMPGVMIQGGSLTNNESYNCGLKIKDEILPGITFTNGSLAIANTGSPDTGGCQFFISLGTNHLWDGKYSIFGKVVEGLDVLQKLNHVPVKDEHAIDPPKLFSVTFHREGPPPVVKKK